jgi:hypothetical protein
VKTAPHPPVSRALPQPPRPKQPDAASKEKGIPAFDDPQPFVDLLRKTLRVTSLSLTALSTRAEALFAQLAAALAFDRALREARRAREVLEEMAFSLRGETPKRAPGNDLPFADSFGLWVHGMNAIFSFWCEAPTAALGSMAMFDGMGHRRQPASPLAFLWPWQSPGKQASPLANPAAMASLAFSVPYLVFGLGWNPAAPGSWPLAA